VRLNPELQKALAILHKQVGEVRLLLPAGSQGDGAPRDAVRRELRDLLDRPVPARTNAAWELVDAFEAVLPRIACREFLATLLELERGLDERPEESWREPWGHYGWGRIRWRDYFPGKELNALLAGLTDQTRTSWPAAGTAAGDPRPGINEPQGAQQRAVERLVALYRMRSEDGRLVRARFAMRARLLLVMALVLIVVLAGLLVVLPLVHDGTGQPLDRLVVLAVTLAGALGGTLSGTRALRKLRKLTDLRLFQAGMIVQPLLGGSAALVLLLLLQSRIVRLPGTTGEGPTWATWALYGFLAGFSEPFFLAIVERVAGVNEEQ
jgi:hypothetical protein